MISYIHNNMVSKSYDSYH